LGKGRLDPAGDDGPNRAQRGMGPSYSAPAAPTKGPVTAGWTDLEPRQIEVRVTDRMAVAAVTLIGPGGEAYAASSIDRAPVAGMPRGGFRPSLAIGASGGSSDRVSSAFGLGLPLGGIDNGPADRQVLSVALIDLEDPAAYRALWRGWRIRIEVGTPDTVHRTIEIAAPRPPDG
jgi:hypothetical protein